MCSPAGKYTHLSPSSIQYDQKEAQNVGKPPTRLPLRLASARTKRIGRTRVTPRTERPHPNHRRSQSFWPFSRVSPIHTPTCWCSVSTPRYVGSHPPVHPSAGYHRCFLQLIRPHLLSVVILVLTQLFPLSVMYHNYLHRIDTLVETNDLSRSLICKRCVFQSATEERLLGKPPADGHARDIQHEVDGTQVREGSS